MIRTLFFLLTLVVFVPPSLCHALDASDLHTMHVEVKRVSDGDTLELVTPIPGFEHGEKVRILGIQAFEEHDDTTGIPDCNATNATKRLDEILGCNIDDDNCPNHPVVTLKVWDETLENRGRPWRYVFFDDGSGEKNVGKQLVEEGYVLAFSHPEETLYNKEVWKAQEAAMANRIGPLWNSNESQCAAGPGSGTDLKMWVNWDAPGDDTVNINGEWIKIKNLGNEAVDLAYWKLRDTGQEHFFEFPGGAVLAPGDTFTIMVGSGTDSGNTFYMDQTSPMFENSIPEGAYLLDYWGSYDLTGEIRAAFTYPCLSNCSDPLQGKISLSAHYDAEGDDNSNPNGEWVDIKNIASMDVDLEMYLLHSLPVGSDTYNFDDNSIIHPGETMRVYIGKGTSSRLEKYWGNSTSILANSQDSVWIDTYNSIEITRYSWPEPEYNPPENGAVIAPIIHLLAR